MGYLDEKLFKCSGHMTKMASRPIYGKTFKNLLLRNQEAMNLKLGIQHRILKYCQICSNDDTGLTVTILYDMVKFVS